MIVSPITDFFHPQVGQALLQCNQGLTVRGMDRLARREVRMLLIGLGVLLMIILLAVLVTRSAMQDIENDY